MNGNIDSLNFKIILDDDDFNKQIEADIKTAKKFNTSLTNVLEARRKAAKMDAQVAKAQAAANKERLKALQTNRQLSGEYMKQSSLLRDLATAGAAYFSVRGARDFLKSVTEITGEYETQKLALSAMWGDAKAAEEVLSRVRKMAVRSPYTFQDLTKYTKQLAAFGSKPTEIVHELNMMADLAAGVGADLSRIILAWGQIRSATVLRGQELRQLTETGLPVMEELAKILTVTEGRLVSVGEVFDMVGKRAVTFDMVRQAFENMTSEGGKFYRMQEVLASSIEGKISNLKDAFQDMLRTVGENNSGAIKGAIDTSRKLIENYQTVGKILAGLIVTYGSYKAALIAVSAAHRIAGMVENIRLIAMCRKELGLLTATQQAFNIASKANIYIALASAVLGVVAALTTFNKRQEEALRTSGQAAQWYEEERKQLKKLIDTAGDESKSKEERKQALDKINGTYSEYLEGMRIETTSAKELSKAYDQVSESLRRKYLEEQRAAMTGDQQTTANNAEAALWGYIKKVVPKSGISAKSYGEIMSRLQNSFGKPGARWGAGDIYNEILAAITGAGGSVSSRTKGALYRRIWDYSEARKDLASAEALFNQFSDGFNSSLKAAADGIDSTSTEIVTKASAVAEGIRAINTQITALEKKARKTGITDAEMKTLSDLREDLDEQKKKYKNLTGGDYGGKADKKSQDKLEDFYKKMARDAARYADEIAQAEIASMEEGNEKVLATLDLQHRQRIRTLQEQYEDELGQLEKTVKEQGGKFDPSTDPRAKALVSKYAQAFIAEDLRYETELAAAEKKVLEEREQNRLEYLQKFGSLKDKENAIREKYQKRIDQADRNGDTYGAKLAKGEMEDELEELKREYSALYGLIFADAETLTDNLLAKAISETQQEIKKAVKDGGDIKELSELYERLRGLTEEKAKRNVWGIGGIVEALGLLRVSSANMNSVNRTTVENAIAQRANALALLAKSGKELANITREAAEALESFPGKLSEIGKMLSGLTDDADNLVTVLTSKDKGEIASAGIGAALNILKMIGNQITENREAMEEWEKALRNAGQAARMREIAEAGKSLENIFGVESPYQKAISGMAKYMAAMDNLAKMQDVFASGKVQTGTAKGISLKNIGVGLGSGAAAGAALGSIIPGLGTLIGAAIGAAVGGIAGALSTETKPVFESILSHYGELFDKDFNLNPKIIDDYELLDETTKEIVDNWDAIRDAATDAMEEMHDNLSNLVGDMADEIRDKLVDAWRSREIYSAVDDIGDYVSGMIEGILEQSVFASVFQDLFTDLQKKMEASFAPGGDQDITDDLEGFLDSYPSLLESYAKAMDAAKRVAEEKGLNLWRDESEREASSKALQTNFSQDTIDYWSGQLTLLVDYARRSDNKLEAITEAVSSIDMDFTTKVQTYLAAIRDDTMSIRGDVNSMRGDMYSVKLAIQNMNDKGVKML